MVDTINKQVVVTTGEGDRSYFHVTRGGEKREAQTKKYRIRSCTLRLSRMEHNVLRGVSTDHQTPSGRQSWEVHNATLLNPNKSNIVGYYSQSRKRDIRKCRNTIDIY